jgi:signal transduction histidine kinase/ActR/RegA family two-component response regulator
VRLHGTVEPARPAEILVVDDDTNVLVTISAVLQLDGYTVTTAQSAAVALGLLRERSFDVVIADLNLEGPSGLHVLSEARRFSPDTSTVVVTGYGTLEAAIQAIRGGVYDFLLKPTDPAQLRLVVARGIERRRLSQQIHEQLRAVEAAGSAIRSSIETASATLSQRGTEATAGLAQRIAENERLSREAREAEKQIRLQAARLQALADASQAFAETRLHLPTLLTTVARRVAELVGDGCVILLLSEDAGHRLEPAAVCHSDEAAQALVEGLLHSVPCLPDEGVVGEVLRTGTAVLTPLLSPAAPDGPGGPSERPLAPATLGYLSHAAYRERFTAHSLLAVPFRVEGRVFGVLAMWQDVSDGSYSDADQVFLQDLADRAALAIENARLYDQVRAALETRETFLASAAHDLKSPLTLLKGQAQLAQRELTGKGVQGGGEPRGRSLVQRLTLIEEAASRMTRMLEELLDLTMAQTGQPLELVRQPVDLVALVRERAAQHQATTSQHRLCFTSAVPALVGEWDRPRLERVLDNLIGNALKYSPDGGDVLVGLAHELHDGRPWASLTVSDEGLGIPAADLPRIFDRFHRGANVLGRVHGTGVGLTSAAQIVRAHGGTIDVTSEEGHGSTFTVQLPLEAP